MPLRLEITLPPQIALDLDPRKVRAVLRSAGSEIAALARRKVRQSTGTGKTYYGKERGKHRASLPGQPPASWTGQLGQHNYAAALLESARNVLAEYRAAAPRLPLSPADEEPRARARGDCCDVAHGASLSIATVAGHAHGLAVGEPPAVQFAFLHRGQHRRAIRAPSDADMRASPLKLCGSLLGASPSSAVSLRKETSMSRSEINPKREIPQDHIMGKACRGRS